MAIPGRIIEINGENAVVDYGGIKKSANISLIECEVGDYILVHVGFAIQKVDKEKARETYSLLNALEENE